MPLYRATVWVLTSTAEVVEGDAGIERRIVERREDSKERFKASVMDDYIYDVDNTVWFGPISEINERERAERAKGVKRGFSN